jgi:hypothetical protein
MKFILLLRVASSTSIIYFIFFQFGHPSLFSWSEQNNCCWFGAIRHVPLKKYSNLIIKEVIAFEIIKVVVSLYIMFLSFLILFRFESFSPYLVNILLAINSLIGIAHPWLREKKTHNFHFLNTVTTMRILLFWQTQ